MNDPFQHLMFLEELNRPKKANGGVSYSGDFTTPQYAQLYYQGLPQLGVTGQILSRLFPNPTTTGAYDAYMAANRPAKFFTEPIQPFQTMDYASVPQQQSIGNFSNPNFYSIPSYNDFQMNGQDQNWSDMPLPDVPKEMQQFNAPAPQAAAPATTAAPAAAPATQGKKRGGSIVDRALMLTFKKA
jgi:hypothetical protein